MYYIQRFYYTCENVTFFLVEMCKHRVRFVQYVGEGNGKVSSRKHWNSYDVRIRSTSRAVFFLKLGCLSGCFDRILLLSASSGYHTLSEGILRIPAKIFDLRQPVQIHIHIQIVPRWYIHVPALPVARRNSQRP